VERTIREHAEGPRTAQGSGSDHRAGRERITKQP
jgi:hypothetical protein